MKSFLKNVGVLFALLLTETPTLFADTNSSLVPQIKHIDSKFILNGQESMDTRTVEKIDTIGNELFVKTGVSLYVYASSQYSSQEFKDMKSKIAFIKGFETNIVKELKAPYGVITLSLADQHVNLLTSPKVKPMVNRDDILSGYIVPLLASHDKNTQEAKISAALLNGYSATAESIATAKGAKLESAISGNGRTFAKVWKIFMYLIVLGGLLAYFYALWKDKQKGKK